MTYLKRLGRLATVSEFRFGFSQVRAPKTVAKKGEAETGEPAANKKGAEFNKEEQLTAAGDGWSACLEIIDGRP